MIIRIIMAAAVAILPSAHAHAQVSGGISGSYVTARDIAEARKKALAAVQPGHGTSSLPIMAYGPYAAKLEYHVGPNIANAHPRQAELFQVLEGSGTLTTGGTVVGTGQGNSITGGAERQIAAGDVFIVPEAVPHWFNRVEGHLVMISVMLPAPTPAPAL